jgi:FixJ family two-component response regulator
MPKTRKFIAIIDDDPSVLKSLGRLLRAHGFTTEAHSSAEAFLDRRPRTKPDVLVLDIDLGGMSGIALRDRLRKSGCQLATIFITALEDTDTHTLATQPGVVILRKPFPAKQLLDAISTHAA